MLPKASLARVARAPLACLALCAGGCLTPPRYAVETTFGVVRAPTRAEAQAAAEQYVADRPALAAQLVDVRDDPIDVWVQRELRATWYWHGPELARGFTVHRNGHAPRIHVQSGEGEHTLAHELVHALLGPTWEHLPQALEEGLCDALAEQTRPTPELVTRRLRAALRRGQQETRLSWRITLDGKVLQYGSSLWATVGSSDFADVGADLEETFALGGRATFEHSTPAEIDYAYGIGYFVASRILERGGVAGMYDLCTRAENAGEHAVPLTWILEAAELTDRAVLEAELYAAWVRASYATALQSPELAAKLVALAERLEPDPREHGAELTWDLFAKTFEVDLAVADEPARPLEDLPDFDAWRAMVWPVLMSGGARATP